MNKDIQYRSNSPRQFPSHTAWSLFERDNTEMGREAIVADKECTHFLASSSSGEVVGTVRIHPSGQVSPLSPSVRPRSLRLK